jgi:predicted HAD superfamily Cof-like phosphohydrolase
MRAGDVLATAHELADVAYAAYVVGWSFGVDLDCIVAELHRSNLSKLAADGTPIHRTDGKVLKGPNFTPPSVARALATDQPLRSPYAQVYNFHTVFDSPCSDSLITDFTPALISLRCALLEEELAEVLAGAQASDLDNLLLELGDVLYVTYGAAVCWGIPLDSVINEVHTANLTTTLRPLAP